MYVPGMEPWLPETALSGCGWPWYAVFDDPIPEYMWMEAYTPGFAAGDVQFSPSDASARAIRAPQGDLSICGQSSCSKSQRRKHRRQLLRQANLQASTSYSEARRQPHGPLMREISRDDCADAVLERMAMVGGLREVFSAALPDMRQLALDPLGHSVLLRLFGESSEDQKRILAGRLAGQVVELAMHPWGCRVLQKAIETVPREQQATLASELCGEAASRCLLIAVGKVVRCSEHQFGNFTLQRCVEQMSPSDLRFFTTELKSDARRLATHEYGCRVLQRLLEYWPSDELGALLDELMRDVQRLCRHRFGNFVIQLALMNGRDADRFHILSVVRERLLEFTRGKYSSRVVERCFDCLRSAGRPFEAERAVLMQAALGNDGVQGLPVWELMSDPYGNYVVQRLIQCSEGADRQKLLALLRGRGLPPCARHMQRHVVNLIANMEEACQ